MSNPSETVRRVVASMVALALLAVTVASFVPLVPSNAWWIRVLDYPRWELLAALLVLVALVLVTFHADRWPARVLVVLGAAGVVHHVVQVWPFTPTAGAGRTESASCDDDSTLRVLSLNVLQHNEERGAVRALIEREDPDLVVLMEVDESWKDGLAPMRERYPYAESRALSNTYGMMLLSKRPLHDAEVRYFTSARVPAITTRLALASGDAVQVYALHPEPPRMGQSADARDAYLSSAALAIRRETTPVLVVGDLNSVPWEDVVARFRRLGRLVDGREGRAYLGTWSARLPVFRIPLDHVLFQNELRLVELARLEPVGSDHFPVRGVLCFEPASRERRDVADAKPGDLRRARADAANAVADPPKGAEEEE